MVFYSSLTFRRLRLRLQSSKAEGLNKQRAALEQRITHWTHIQTLFMPRVTSYRNFTPTSASTDLSVAGAPTSSDDPEDNLDAEDDSYSACLGGVEAESFELMLPSHPTCIARQFADSRLAEKEVKIRLIRLEASLAEIRRLLRIRTSVYLDKKANSVGQKSGTRSHVMLTSYNKKIEDTHKHYNDDRQAALRLDPDGNWTRRYKDLKKEDLRAAHEDEGRTLAEGYITTARVPGESQRTLSWIWKVPLSDRDRSRPLTIGDTPVTLATEEEVGEGATSLRTYSRDSKIAY